MKKSDKMREIILSVKNRVFEKKTPLPKKIKQTKEEKQPENQGVIRKRIRKTKK